MSKNPNWLWKLHFLIYFSVASFNFMAFWDPESEIAFYYHTLLAYDRYFFFPYALNVLAVLCTAFTLVPFYCFLFQRQIFKTTFWRFFFVFRLALDITGRSYEFKVVQAMFYHDAIAGIHLSLFALLLFLPSYIALFLYAFKPKPSLVMCRGQ